MFLFVFFFTIFHFLLLFVPTYGGLPPALWVAFTQRQQGILEKPSEKEQKNFVVSAVALASPQWSGIGERTPSIVADQIKNMDRKVAGFEIVNNAGFKTENLFGELINEEEIRSTVPPAGIPVCQADFQSSFFEYDL